MSNSREDRFYTTAVGKSRRTTPTGDSQGSIFFQGQGGRTVLPPLSSAFPTSHFPVPPNYSNQYTQPRSSPGRYDINAQALYSQWPSPSPTPASASFPSYEQERYAQPSYTTTSTYPSSRSSPPLSVDPADSRKLPPLATSSPAGERWTAGTSYLSTSPAYSGAVRSPASYHAVYTPYPAGGQAATYTYHLPIEQPAQTLQPMSSPSHVPYDELPRTTSPFHRSGAATSSNTVSSTSHSVPPPSYNPPPVSPSSADEPTIKKKRKRADAAQLKVLNETYARTAFPSTEERLALAKMLDMSARSVQIWFQNKRQAMRQTNRQSSNLSQTSHHQGYGTMMSNQADSLDDLGHHSAAGGYSPPSLSMSDPSFNIPRGLPDASRASSSQSSSPHRRMRPDELLDTRKWAQSY